MADPLSKFWRWLAWSAHGLLLAFAAFLLFYGLGDRLLWGDEAETATLAKNVLQFGIPKSFDGLNRITLLGADKDANRNDVWTWSPWLQEYITAGSYLVFAPTTWASRAPFALIGWLSLVLLGRVAWQVYRDHWVAWGAMFLLVTSEFFLLHARQCRYYSISVLGEIAFVYGLYQLLNGRRAGVWLTTTALAGLFYTNYIFAMANLPVTALAAWAIMRQNRARVWWIGIVGGGFLVLVTPWVLYARLWQQSGALIAEPWLGKALHYLREFHFHVLPLVVFAFPVIGFWRRKSRQPVVGADAKAIDRKISKEEKTVLMSRHLTEAALWEKHLVLLLPAFLLVVLIPPGAYLRYLLPLLPVGCLLTAAWIFRTLPGRGLGLLAILVLALTNALPLATGYPLRGEHRWRWPIFEFVRGTTHTAPDRLADIVAFFQRVQVPGQTLYSCDPEFPLVFYTKLRVLDSRFVLDTGGLPDWVLSESASGVREQEPLALPVALQAFYETIRVPVHDTSRIGVVPDPDTYEFLDRTPAVRTFLIYQKRSALNRSQILPVLPGD